MSQHTDKFYAAVRTLAGNGPLKKRLASAYGDNLAHLPSEELPETIRPHFESLRHLMLAIKPVGGENPILATVRKMSPTDANRCADQIVTMLSEMERAESNNKRKARPGTGAQLADLASSPRSLN